MSEKYKFHNPEGIYFTTSTIVDWIDLFTRRDYCEIVVDSIRYCQMKKDLRLHAWSLMTNHLHLIISAVKQGKLSDILRDFKSHTNEKLIECINSINESRKEWMLEHFQHAAQSIKRVAHNKIWQDGNHPIELSTNEMIDQRLNYTHYNPVKAGFVLKPEHYVWSSAIDYCGGKGLLKIDFID